MWLFLVALPKGQQHLLLTVADKTCVSVCCSYRGSLSQITNSHAHFCHCAG